MPIYERDSSKFQVSVGSESSRYKEDFDTKKEAEKAELIEMLPRKGSSLVLVEKSIKYVPTLKELLKECECDKKMWAIKSRKNVMARANVWLEYLGEDLKVTEVSSKLLKDTLLEIEADHEWTSVGVNTNFSGMKHFNIQTTQNYMHLAQSKMGEGKTALEDYIKENRPKLKAVPRKTA